MRSIDELDHYELLEIPHAAAIRSRLDEAYRVLADPETRKAYDQEKAFDDPRSLLSGVSGMSESGGAAASGSSDSSLPRVEQAFEAFDEVVEEYDALEDEGGGEFDGVRLRRTRLFRGFEIIDICDVTKVSGAHLRNIEDENYGDLPADVYVRGFVTAYAQTIGLDPKVVVPSYMARMLGVRGDSSRSRFLGRR
jgi:curved DNA-binding protein CbpA